MSESKLIDVNYAIGKCFTCGVWLGGEKDKYCEEHRYLTFNVSSVINSGIGDYTVNWSEERRAKHVGGAYVNL